MNNRKKLLEFLKELPEENFDYRVYFNRDGCNTTGCVAGWCTEQFAPKFAPGGNLSENDPVEFSRNFLKLSEADARFLFHYASGRATLSDAIKRLEWLVDHGSFEGYPMHKESYYVPGSW